MSSNPSENTTVFNDVPNEQPVKNQTGEEHNHEDHTDEQSVKTPLTSNQKKKLRQREAKKKKKIEPSTTMTPEQVKEHEEKLIQYADALWKFLKQLVKENPKFAEWKDKEKLDYFRDTLGHKEFMNEHPILTRYMICMGQYSSKAFKRFLEKVRLTVHPPPNKREKGYMEDQWVRRQTDYVRYLWESYQKGHFNHAEANWIWQDTYKKLKGEFDDFRDKYKDIENKVKEDTEKFKAENVKDLLLRLKTGEQELDEKDEKELMTALRVKLYQRRHANMLEQIKKSVKEVPASCESEGIGAPEPIVDKSKPTITMVETVDENRMGEIDDRYKLAPIPEDK